VNEWSNEYQESRRVCFFAACSGAQNDKNLNIELSHALATVLCTFCRPHLPKVHKSAPSMPFFCDIILKCIWALATVLRTFCLRFSQIEARIRGNRDPPSATMEATLPEKTQGFSPQSVFTREFTRSRTVTLPNYLMMVGWHDDVVAMMVGMLAMTIVRNSEVF
jgi:hypothetical protein